MDIQFLITVGAGILSVASIVLHIVAPRTKATWDDDLLRLIDSRIAKGDS